MPKRRPRGIQIEQIGRDKKITAYYYRAGRGTRIRLPDEYGTEKFWRAYDIARESGVSCRPPTAARPWWKKQREQTIEKLKRAVKQSKKRASKNGMNFDIDEDWAISEAHRLKFKCSVTGIPFYSSCKGFDRINPYSPSIDRIDPKGGYTKDNVRIIVFALNVMLMDWGHEVFEFVAKRYRYQKAQNVKILFPNISTLGTRRRKSNKINA